MATTAVGERRIDPALRRLVWVLVLGALPPALDTTIVNVALATLGRELHVSVATSQWTVTGYLLAMATAMPMTGWLSERFGGRRAWLFALTLFLAGSVLSGAAWDVGSLIVFRIVQGGAAGLIMPIVTTLLVQAGGPKRLGAVMAVAMLPVVVVPVFGPVVGGLLIDELNWRWIFFVNVPLCVAAVVLAARTMPHTPPKQNRYTFDGVGLALLSPGLALTIYGLSQVARGAGSARPGVLLPVAAGLVLTAAFAMHALRRPERPLIDLRLLGVRAFAASLGVLFLAGLSVYGPLLLIALYYQDVLGTSALVTGLILGVQGLGSLLPRGIAGSLTDRVGPRVVVLGGLLLVAAGTAVFTQAGPTTKGWLLAASLFIRGAGLAPVTIAVMAGAFQGVPEHEVPDAASATRIVQQIGGSFGAAVLTVILTHGLRHATTATTRAHGFNTAFWWAIGFVVLALVPALMLPRTKAPTGEPG